MRSFSTRALMAALFLTACTQTPDAVPAHTPSRIADGRALAETYCSGCHAIGRHDDSPHPEAKPFRSLSETYPIETLAEPLAEGILTGHPDMPVFQFGHDEIDAMIAYLESIQTPSPV